VWKLLLRAVWMSQIIVDKWLSPEDALWDFPTGLNPIRLQAGHCLVQGVALHEVVDADAFTRCTETSCRLTAATADILRLAVAAHVVKWAIAILGAICRRKHQRKSRETCAAGVGAVGPTLVEVLLLASLASSWASLQNSLATRPSSEPPL